MASSDAEIVMPPVSRQTTSQRVAQAIRTYIDEHLEPGDRLPAERNLCQMLGVGRTTLREALRVLQSQGRVSVRAGSGAYVTVPGDSNPFARWPEQLDVTVKDLLGIRLLLESPAAALAATSDVPVEEKRALLTPPLEVMEAATEASELERRVASDLAFHNAIAQLTGNPVLTTALDQLSSLLTESRRVSLSYQGRLARVQDAHTRIRDAILDGDPECAAQAMTMHLAAFGADMGIGSAQVAVPSQALRLIKVEDLADATARDLAGDGEALLDGDGTDTETSAA